MKALSSQRPQLPTKVTSFEPFPNNPKFNNLGKITFEHIMGKEGNAVDQHFLLFPSFSALSRENFVITATFESFSANARISLQFRLLGKVYSLQQDMMLYLKILKAYAFLIG